MDTKLRETQRKHAMGEATDVEMLRAAQRSGMTAHEAVKTFGLSKVPYVEYSSNNSGGSWWLSDDDWRALEAAGWTVSWAKDGDQRWLDGDGRYMGVLAREARLYGATEEQAVDSFQTTTGHFAWDSGCDCCGPPHHFSARNEDGEWV